jgi:hypothetical protein
VRRPPASFHTAIEEMPPNVRGRRQGDEGEGHLFMLNCERIDQQAFRAAGGTVLAEQSPPGGTCSLDNVSDPVKLLSSIAARPVGVEQRLVPVR